VLQQIQSMLNKQTEEMKALQHPTQIPKAINSPPSYIHTLHLAMQNLIGMRL